MSIPDNTNMDNTANQSASSIDSTSQPPLNPSTKLNPIRKFKLMWIANRWLAVAIAAGASILVLLLLLGVLLLIDQALSKQPSTEPQSQLPTIQDAANKDPEDDEFFASQPLTMIYYSFSQTINSKNMVQATPLNRETRILPIGYPDKYEFLSSPDGKWLLRWDNQTLAKASSSSPSDFTPIFTTRNKDITSVIWQQDGSSIAVVTSQGINNPQTGQALIDTSIELIPLLTLKPIVVLEDQAEHQYELVAFPATTRLYYQLRSNNILSDLTSYDTQTKNIHRRYTNLDENNLLSQLQFTADMSKAYKFTDTQVIRYDLQSMESETIFTIDRDCGVHKDNLSTISNISVAPSGEYVVIVENRQACERNRGNDEEDPNFYAKNRVGFYAEESMGLLHEKYDSPITGILMSAWSPEEKMVWLQVGVSDTYIASVTDFEITPIPSLDRQSLYKERLFLIGWLRP